MRRAVRNRRREPAVTRDPPIVVLATEVRRSESYDAGAAPAGHPLLPRHT